ncbi:hypothetical protein BN903_46 [Halorubrum sp. AJ67]|nr:hypothetical protein BN903_46 [Halorubrum sp. AJ67]
MSGRRRGFPATRASSRDEPGGTAGVGGVSYRNANPTTPITLPSHDCA